MKIVQNDPSIGGLSVSKAVKSDPALRYRRTTDILGFLLFVGILSFSIAQLLPLSGAVVNDIAYLFIVLPTLLLMLVSPISFARRLSFAWPLWLYLGAVLVVSFVQDKGFVRSTILVAAFCAGVLNLLSIRPKAVTQAYGGLAFVALLSLVPALYQWLLLSSGKEMLPRLALLGHARNPIYAGLLVVSVLMFCWFVVLERRDWLRAPAKYVLTYGACIVLCLAAVTIFQSRSALIGLVASFIVHCAKARQLRYAMIAIVLLACAMWVAGFGDAIAARGLSYRPDIWRDALGRLGNSCSLLLGCGRTDEIFLGLYKGSHSGYVGTLLRHGLIGGVSFLVFAVWYFWRGLHAHNPWFMVSLVGWGGMLTAMDGFVGGPHAWWVFFWIPTLAAIHATADRDAQSAKEDRRATQTSGIELL